MVSRYHEKIQKEVVSYGADLKKDKKIRDVFEGNKDPLSIVDPKSKSVVNYQPDAYYLLKNNKKLIFEILDSEEKKQDIIIADIIRSILVENVEGIVFIYSGKVKVENTIMESLKTMYKGLIKLGVSTSKLPGDKYTAPYAITKVQAKNRKKIRGKLVEYFPFGNNDRSL